jgi:hypothetical protein
MPGNYMKCAFFAIFVLLIACSDKTEITPQCASMTISDALPVQFWLNGCETFNESEPDGVFYSCFCQKFECDDTINFQFTDNSGDAFTLEVLDDTDSVLTSIPFDKYQNIYSLSFTPSSIGCPEVVRFQISRADTVSELMEDPEFDIGGNESLNFDNPDFSSGVLTPWEQPAFGAFGPISATPWVYQADGGNHVARFDAAVSPATTTKFLSQPKPGGGSWPAGDYQFAYHVANLSASGTTNVDILLVAVFEDLTYQLLDTKNPSSGAGFVSYSTSVSITRDAVGIGIIAKRNTAGSDLDVKVSDLSISAPVVVDSIWQNSTNGLSTPYNQDWTVNGGNAQVTIVNNPALHYSKALYAPFSAGVPVAGTITLNSQVVFPGPNTYNLIVALYNEAGDLVQTRNLLSGQATGTILVSDSFTVDNEEAFGIGLITEIASNPASSTVQVNYLRVSGNTETIEAYSDCVEIAETWENTKLLEYSNRRNYAGIVNDGSAGTPDQTTFYLRVPAVFNEERYPESVQAEPLSNNQFISLNSQVEKQKLLETDYIPAYMHLKIQLVIKHQFLQIDGVNYVQRESYEKADGNKRDRFRKATVYLTERDYIVRNLL